jgi:hypothetical protein
MEYYRQVYKDSERWNGVDDLTFKHVIIYCEQGFGDIIQFARYVPVLKTIFPTCRITMHCPVGLHSLFEQLGVELLDKDCDQLPPHDYHIPSMSLPFALNQIEAGFPYLSCNETEPIEGDGLKVGIAWEGNPDHSNNSERSCPLYFFNYLRNARFFMLQQKIHNIDLIHGCDEMQLFTIPIETFKDTARLVNAMDIIVTVDTSVLHLAGAMGKETYALLSHVGDPRWTVANWYPSVTLVRQRSPGDWEGVFVELESILKQKGKL